MPQAAIEALAEFLATYVFTSAGGYAIATAVATVVVGAIASFSLGKISQLLAGTQANANGPPSQTVTVQGTVEPRRGVYGQVLTAGVIVFDGAAASTGTLVNDYLWFVIALAGHQVDSITDVYFGPDLISDSMINGSTGAVTSGKYAGFANIWRHTGAHGDTVQSEFATAFPSPTNFTGTGVAKIYIRLLRSQTVYTSGAPANFRALVKGKRVYDPRLDSTNGGTGSQRLSDATTWLYSANPALCAADYMTAGSVYYDVATPLVVVGMKIPTNRVNWSFVANAANECDQTVSLPGATTQPRYVLGCVLSMGDTHDTNLDVILAAMIGQRIFSQGMYRIYAGEYDAPGVSLGDNDLTSDGYTVAGATTGTDLYNAVVASYFDPNRDWQSVNCAVRTQTTYETADGGQRLLRSIVLSGVTDEYRAQRICEVIKKQSRNQIVVTLSLKLTGVKLAPWETFNLTLVEQGWQNKVFRAMEIDMDLAGRRIVVTAREESSSPYADPLTTDYAAPGTAAPGSTSELPDDPTGLTATGAPYGIAFSWNKNSYFAPGSSFELWEFTSSTPFSSAAKVASGIITTSYFLPKADTVARFYWIRAVNIQGQLSGTNPGVTGVSGAAIQVGTGFIANNAVTTTQIAPATILPANLAAGTATQVPATTTFTGPTTVTITIPAGGKQQMILELFGDSGLGNHGNTGIPTFGGGGASGGYAKSVYALTAADIGHTVTATLQAASSSPTASTIVSGTFAITTMSVVGGGDGVAGTVSVNGAPGSGAPPATGGNVINQMGADGRIGVNNNKGPGPGVTGTYAVGNSGGLGTASNTVTNAGGPAIAVVTFI